MLYQLVLDGTGTDGSQTIEYKTSGAFGDLTIKGCEVKNYTKGFIYINTTAVTNTINIDNCLIHVIECNGGDFIDSRKGGWNNLNLTNSTIYNSAAKRDIFRADPFKYPDNGDFTIVDEELQSKMFGDPRWY